MLWWYDSNEIVELNWVEMYDGGQEKVRRDGQVRLEKISVKWFKKGEPNWILTSDSELAWFN